MSNIQEIGIVINLSLGIYSNTIYKDGKIQLIQLDTDINGKPVYADEGYWISSPILIQDKIRSFKNLVKTIEVNEGATIKSYVRTSEDGFEWNDFIEVNEDGSIENPPAKYAQIKIEFLPERDEVEFYVDNFEVKGRYENDFVNSDGGVLELKKKYSYTMDYDDELHTKVVRKSLFKKIDKIRVESI